MTQDIGNAKTAVNELIETCIDGQNGYEAAAEAIDDPQLKSELLRYSEQRADFARELQRLLVAAGEAPKDHGSVSAAMHRGWINLRSSLTSHDRHAILAECERGEDSAVSTYRDAINGSLPPSLADEVASQYQAILSAHDHVKGLRDASKPN